MLFSACSPKETHQSNQFCIYFYYKIIIGEYNINLQEFGRTRDKNKGCWKSPDIRTRSTVHFGGCGTRWSVCCRPDDTINVSRPVLPGNNPRSGCLAEEEDPQYTGSSTNNAPFSLQNLLVHNH